jgi:hypothetical protein
MNEGPRKAPLAWAPFLVSWSVLIAVCLLAPRQPDPPPPVRPPAPVATSAVPVVAPVAADAGAAPVPPPVRLVAQGELGVLSGPVPKAAAAAGAAGAPPVVVAVPGSRPAADAGAEPAGDLVRVEGVIRDERGIALRGASVGNAVTRSDGHFVTQAPAGQPIQVRHRDYPTLEVAFAPTLEVTLSPGGGVEGFVRDGGTGMREMSFVLAGRGPGGATARTSGSGGFFRLLDLAPGRWILTASSRGRQASAEVDVIAGTRPGEVTLRDVPFELPR